MLQTARTVRIHLFGRPHLTNDAAPLKFKAPARALSLLAYLLVHPGAPPARDAVAFALWPDDREADARANLRRHLFYLTNDVLPEAPRDVPWIVADKRTIAWNAAAPAWCDAREFERLGADLATAQHAVALYCGDLLEGFEDEWLQAPRERLRERQVRLLLDLMLASRAQKEFEAGIGYARCLLNVDPWREDGIRTLIQLRHASGDRAGALATYHDFAKRLHDEMGVEPMPETTAEYERVAAAREPLAGTVAGGVEPAVEHPHWRAPQSLCNSEAIRPVPSFTGREAELAALDAALWEGGGLAALHGLGGVGKSALAREYARRYGDRYSAVWWLNAETEAGIIDGLIALGSEFEPELAKHEDRRAAAQRVAANVLSGLTKPVLLVFDNLDDERLLRAWSPRCPAHLLVTSRHAVWGGDVAATLLEPFPPGETVRYLRREIGRDDFGDADALLLAETLGRLPLALAHAAAYLKSSVNVTARRYLERINDHLARAPKGADYVRAVFATFEAAIARAEEDAPGAAALLCLAACFAPDAMPEELLQQSPAGGAVLLPFLSGGAAPARDLQSTVNDAIVAEEALAALHRFSLLTFARETRSYTMHRLVQKAAQHTFARDQDAWVQAAVTAAETAFPQPEFALWGRCEALAPHARAALAALPADARFAPAARLALRCGRYLFRRAAFAEAEPLLRRGLALAEACARRPADPEVAEHLAALGALLRDTNRLFEAEPLQRRALAIFETECGLAHPRVAASLGDLAVTLHYWNRLAEAETLLRRALAIDEAAFGTDHPTVALRLHNLALALHDGDDAREAETLLRRALAIDEAAAGAHHPDVGSDAASLGWLLLSAGREAEAEPLLRRAVTIRAAAYGDTHPAFAHALGDIGVLLHDTGRLDEARRSFERALQICETAFGSEHPIVAAYNNNVAELLSDAGCFEEAEALYRRALAIDEKAYGRQNAYVARDLNNLAGALYAAGRPDDAEAPARQALAILAGSYAADHPRVKTIRDNVELLPGRGNTTTLEPQAGPSQRWRSVRRSAARGLR